ncbi:MAG: hypothetical protein EU530_06395 [Promethearchaeota archaeon]|nr:MAG: hypothetical protein EU530_06395 [Candidatus Lokiarchaeota archaeon]
MTESINQISVKNQQRRYTYLLLGLVFIATSILMAVFVFQTIQYFFAALVFILGALLVGMFFSLSPKILSEGLWTYKKSDTYREEVTLEAKFVSIPWSRFYAAILFLAIGILDYFFLGAYFGPPEDIPVEQFHGTALTLGNMSFFWLVGFPALVIGTVLLVKSLLSSYPGNISQSKNIYYVHERRLLFPKLTEIAKTEVEGLRYQNTNIGHRILWLLYLIPSALLMLKYGVPMFDEPRAETLEFSIMMTLTAVVHIICLILLIGDSQNYLELVTGEKYYEMWFSPQETTARTKILNVLEYEGTNIEGRGVENFENLGKDKGDFLIFREKQRQYFRLIMGITILVISALSYAFQVLFGALFWFGGVVFGVGMIFIALFSDFNTTQRVYFNQGTGKFYFGSTFGKKNVHLGAFKIKNVSLTPHLRRLKAFEVISAMWLTGIPLIQTIYSYVYGDFTHWIIILETVATTLLTFGLIMMFFLYFCVPVNHLKIESETFTYYHEIPQNEEKWGPFKKPFKKIMKSPQLTARLIGMGVIILISAAVAVFYILS